MTTRFLQYFPKPLLEDLVAGRWLPVIGAGMSKNAIFPAGKSIPLWGDLGKAIAADMVDYNYNNPIDAISAYEFEYGRAKLIERFTSLLLIAEGQPGATHKAFCSIQFDTVCTTNFDFLLEKQYALTPRLCTPLLEEEQLSIGAQQFSVGLLKLHGDLNHPQRLVATEEDYDGFLLRYPLIATYMANFLITRTAVLIGYSLDDPDFRQLWQLVGDRLGKTRRVSYVIMVDAKSTDISRFDRRGLKVVSLPSGGASYAEVLTEAFNELRDYWRESLIEKSEVTEEASLNELSLPPSSANRLCFFAVPSNAMSFYRDRVFPLVRKEGLVPVTVDDVVTPGGNLHATVDTLMSRAAMMIVDVSAEWSKAEVKMALSQSGKPLLAVVEQGSQLSPDIQQVRVLSRPALASVDTQAFLDSLVVWLHEQAALLAGPLSSEPRRLLELHENRAAVIAAMTRLEVALRDAYSPISITMMAHSAPNLLSLIQDKQLQWSKYPLQQLREWAKLRNQAVHTSAEVTPAQALEIVGGVEDIIQQMPVNNPPLPR